MIQKQKSLKAFLKRFRYLVVRGLPEEVFLNYRFDQEKSKVLYSYYRKRIPNSFSGTIFNRQFTMTENGKGEGDFSRIYFILLVDRLKEKNQHLNNVSISRPRTA